MRFQDATAPEGPARGADGATYLPSSFGHRFTDAGPRFSARALFESERARRLDLRERHFRCTQHDDKVYDWQGRACPPGLLSTQPLLGAALPTHYVPLDLRRPNDPYRLAKLIVGAFTALVFGEGMWPEIKVSGDARTQDFARELARAQALADEMTLARDVGGSTGTVGLSWRFCDGLPRVAVHRPQHVHVHEWADYERLVPAHVTRLTQVERPVRLLDGRHTTMRFWQRFDWTPEADVAFREEPVDPKHEPDWQVESAAEHGDGFCHFVWIRNLRDTDESAIDGLPDFDGLVDNLDTLDVLSSVVTRGGVLNLDPTLVIKADIHQINRYGVRKGSDNAICLDAKDAGSDAKFLELAGTSIASGRDLIASRRAHALEVAQCVVPDPNTIAAAGTSRVALELVYRPMLARANLMRGSYGRGIVQLLEQQIESARNLTRVAADVPEQVESEAPESGERPLLDEEGLSDDRSARELEGDPDETNPADEPRQTAIRLSPRVVEEELLDEQTEQPTGEIVIRFEERDPGEGGDLELVWPDYFEPTPADRQQEAATLSVASGGRPILSHRTCVERAARLAGVDPNEEWRRVREQLDAERGGEAAMFPETGLGAGLPESATDLPAADEDLEVAAATPGAEADLSMPGAAQIVKLSPDFVPNGAQISAAIDIVSQVRKGELPRDSGLGLLEVMFNLDAAAALKIMGSAGTLPPLGETGLGEGGSRAPQPPAAPGATFDR